ncbi:hypothetical protein DWY22_13055 [Heyndrickxia coagulans]|nr:hypothetical protein DWY22_13055 [Heyndrickxia coagulans]RGR98019.1 hypothetical protein DWY16_08870 [Heyndrickxia coagulans]
MAAGRTYGCFQTRHHADTGEEHPYSNWKGPKKESLSSEKICKISKVQEGQQEMLKLRKNLEIAGEKSI